MVPARFSLVTLGVADVARSRPSTGPSAGRRPSTWTTSRCSARRGRSLALYPIADLSRDIGDDTPADATRRSALAINVASAEEVDAAIAEALAAGGALLAAPAPAEWGGYTGYLRGP